MHLVAGGVSAVIAVLVALYLAVTLSRPLRRIRAGADAMSAGDLDVRVPETGDDEIAAVADALNRLAETLQQEEGLRKESVADLAHELRTPVMGILARVEAAQDGVLEGRSGQPLGDARRGAAPRPPARRPLRARRGGATRPAARRRARGPRGHRRRADSGVRRRVRRQGHRAVVGAPSGGRRRRTQAPRADRREPALERPALHRCRRLRARRRAPRRRRRASRSGRHRHRHRRRGPAARVHPVLARREVALAGHRRGRHRAVHREGARAGARRKRHRRKHARRGLRLPRRASARGRRSRADAAARRAVRRRPAGRPRGGGCAPVASTAAATTARSRPAARAAARGRAAPAGAGPCCRA